MEPLRGSEKTKIGTTAMCQPYLCSISKRHAIRLALVAAAVSISAVLGAAVVTTDIDRQPLSFLKGPGITTPPDWTKPCWRRAKYTLPCARVHGRVIFRQRVDSDGDGDHHVVVITGFGLTILKLRKSRGLHFPSYGSRVVATGLFERGSGQLGLDVVDVAILR